MISKKTKTGQRIGYLRRKHNMSQKTLGERIGVGYTTISNYERGYSSPDVNRLKQLGSVFGVDINYFIDESSECYDKLMQSRIVNNQIPYYTNTNINGIITGDIKLANSVISLPSDIVLETDSYICTKTIDNSMSNTGITKNSYIIINRKTKPTSGSIVAVFDTAKKSIIIRKYINDGPMVLFVADGYENSETICTNINDTEYSVIGTVEKAIINF